MTLFRTFNPLKSRFIQFCFLILSVPAWGATQINGAGATFPYPLYSKWFAEYQKKSPDVQINYQSIGSGGGIRQFMDRTIDFGATDSPMTVEQRSKLTAKMMHLPMAAGAVVLTYQLPGLKGDLKLTGDVIADIFLGKITQWNDARITGLNPGFALPATTILVARRSDGSGTTAIFTEYLASVSAEWKTKAGVGTSVKWPTGLGGKGNEGVTGLIKQTPGAIGYVELVYAENNRLPVVTLKNPAGQWVKPSASSVTAAAESALKAASREALESLEVSLIQAQGKEAYPMSGLTYLLVWQENSGPKGRAWIDFLKWAMKDGQGLAQPLAYAALPKNLIKKVEEKIQILEKSLK